MNIGAGIKGSVSKFEIHNALNNSKVKSAVTSQLEALKGILNDNGRIPKIGTVLIGDESITTYGATPLTLKTNLSNSEIFDTVIQKLSRNQIVDTGEVEKLFSTLGNIATTVTRHTQNVVQNVMQNIKNKIEEELKDTVGAVELRFSDFSQLVTDRSGRSVGPVSNKAEGLQWLITKFEKNVKQTIETLQSTFNDTFKQTGAIPRGKDKYEFGPKLMEAFNTTNADLVKGDVMQNKQNVLDEHIGHDILAGSGDQNKIAEIADTFTKYRQQIVRDSLTNPDPNQLQGKLPEAISAIKTTASGITVQGTKLSMDNLGKKITSDLEALLNAFSATGKVVKDKLVQLQKDIGMGTKNDNTLQKIHDKLSDILTKDFAKAIDEARNFDAIASTRCRETIGLLTEHVNSCASSAMSTLTTHAHQQYVLSLKEALTAFADKVHRELNMLVGPINNDLHAGLKGFMHKIEESLVKKIEGITTIDPKDFTQKSPLSKGAEILNVAFTSFYNALKQQSGLVADFWKVKASDEALYILLKKLSNSQHFNNEFRDNCDKLTKSLRSLTANIFAADSTLICDALRHGYTALLTELDKAYVNKYSGIVYAEELVMEEKTLTEYGKRCAKVFLTILKFYCDDLNGLQKHCAEKSVWRGRQIYASTTAKRTRSAII
ncbi:hypothetical protein, conserved [Babesia bigemina]|uniref:Uncharacterized protein n=1 Tax=Babesia bigemina TaxID=5866 RepID=A0A061BJ47_BABBI|nr:hypothetical protein, conserved [Babesia bigemina]CDR71519.1 hypothetical protein, conserved [Babesia bigemina]|eukprot:XP_012770465.1 hypothetical protein, conserved [Babesia bigemina]